MAKITIKELQDKYPKIYPIIKAAQDFDNARDILNEEMIQIVAKFEKGGPQEETMESISVIHAVIGESFKVVEHAKKAYEVIHKTLSKHVNIEYESEYER